MQKGKNTAFLKGTLSLSVAVIATKILGVAFKVPLSYVLGDEGMGYFNTAYAIYGFFYILCTAGVPKSLTLVISEYRNRDGTIDGDREILVCTLRFFFKIGIFSTLFNIICAPALAIAVGNKGAMPSMVAIAPSMLFVSMSASLRGYLNSEEKLGTIAVSQFIEGAVKLALGLALALLGVYLNTSVVMISALAISGITVGSFISFVYMIFVSFSLKTNDNSRQSLLYPRREIRQRILKNAIPIALSSALLNLSSILDLAIIIKRLVVSGMSESYANSVYGNYTTLAVPMFNLVISVLAPIAMSYMPRLAQMHLNGATDSFSETLNRLLWITLVISVPASLSFYFYSFDLLDVLFSLQSSALGAPMLIALSFGLCFLASLTVINTALESQRRIIATVISLLIGSTVKLAVSYLLIGRGEIGILGAPVGTVISYAISLAISLYLLEGSGIRVYAMLKLCAFYIVGLFAFLPPYILIYSSRLVGTSFTSMVVSIFISLFVYSLLLALAYAIVKLLKVFKLHKKEQSPLAERPKN